MQRQDGEQTLEMLQLNEFAPMEGVTAGAQTRSVDLPIDLLIEEMSQTMNEAFKLLNATENKEPQRPAKNVS